MNSDSQKMSDEEQKILALLSESQSEINGPVSRNVPARLGDDIADGLVEEKKGFLKRRFW
jgi:hypothetical protein